ncbi:MAG: hypothetical protein ACRDL6_07425 [Solirubrobacterales bacterium]
MEMLRGLGLSFWVVLTGVVVLYVFFIALAEVSPGEVAGVTAVVAATAAVVTVRNLRVAGELGSRGGDPRVRRARNRMRERRGF